MNLRTLFEKYEPYTVTSLICIGLFLLGAVTGSIWEKHLISQNAPGLTQIAEASSEIPLVSLEKIENGILFGKNEGEQVRFKIGATDATIEPTKEGDFSFPVTEILPNLQMIPAPEGMNFTASKRGSKYWPLDAAEAELITPKNRIFFRSEEEAKEKGFERGV